MKFHMFTHSFIKIYNLFSNSKHVKAIIYGSQVLWSPTPILAKYVFSSLIYNLKTMFICPQSTDLE
jgi:hypothetical protein